MISKRERKGVRITSSNPISEFKTESNGKKKKIDVTKNLLSLDEMEKKKNRIKWGQPGGSGSG